VCSLRRQAISNKLGKFHCPSQIGTEVEQTCVRLTALLILLQQTNRVERTTSVVPSEDPGKMSANAGSVESGINSQAEACEINVETIELRRERWSAAWR
jgi:hypothetical protein